MLCARRLGLAAMLVLLTWTGQADAQSLGTINMYSTPQQLGVCAADSRGTS
ncbi:MAG: hypothetical protein M3R04_10650 [bacterium]|nr:hypothetical protein [bacterium]